ncbi:unnamed protein product [Chilo suppressalis]|uniref:Odorant receptor n=1 Tax=Chilo suppressalis TaxID=168631 RepID=A0ABN8BEE4_CHISP|nr:hypothetical protein evm_013927 [Chilo suppressalis]CAH0406460.1 unnamed protein product [Chilo suppressalis]
MIGHIMILINNIKNIEMPKTCHNIEGFKTQTNVTVELYDYEENEILRNKIVEIVNHHRFILRFVSDVSFLLGPALASTYLCHLISCCLLLIECSQLDPDALAQYGPITVIMFYQLFQISVLFELLGAKSEKLIDAVYELPWECMDVRNQRLLCFLLQRVQTPVQVTALGLTKVGVTPMVAILKTTYSLFAFLRSTV